MKRLLILIPFSLFVFILFLYEADTTVHTESLQTQDWKFNCDNVDVKMKKEIKELTEILDQNDLENLKNRINKLLSSIEQLEAEKKTTENAICVDIVRENRNISAKMNVYHSLLAYAIEMKADEDIQFDKLTLEILENEELLQLEAILQDSDSKVHIDYYNTYSPVSVYYANEDRLLEEKILSPFVNALTFELASRTYHVIQNPVEKFIRMVDQYFTGKSELDLEIFEKQALNPASRFSINFSIITSDISYWEQLYMAEYYPTDQTYKIIERWQSIHNDYPHINFPEEDLLSQNWYEVSEVFSEIKREYRSDGTDYILKGTIGINNSNIEDEELIEALERKALDQMFDK